MNTDSNAQNVPNTVPNVPKRAREAASPPRGITVYKRVMLGGHESGTYYCRFRVRGKDGKVRQPQLDTGCTDYRAAIKWAMAQKAAQTSGQKGQVLAAMLSQDRPGVPTIGKMLAEWLKGQTTANEATAKRTVNSFRMVWREALDVPSNDALDSMTVNVCTKPALLAWIATRQGLEKPNFRSALPANNAIAARLREMRSILSPGKRAHLWEEAGLAMPDFSSVLSVPMPMLTETPFRWIDEPTMEAIEAAVDAAPDENMKRAFWLMRLLAMRNCEVAACRAGWAETMDGKRFIRICHRPAEGFTLKRRENVRLLEIPVKIASYFDGPPEKHLLTGCATERTGHTFRRLNHLIRQFLPDRVKGAYEMRKQRISEEMVSTGSIVAAAALAGDLVATIERHYCDISANLPALRMRRAKVLEGGAA